MRNRKGFTLIEMLVVIAIIAILVSVIVPSVSSATKKAKAATDAANLRSILGIANSVVYSGDLESALSSVHNNQVRCQSFKDAKMYIAFSYPGFVEIMFVEGEVLGSGAKYYNISYFSDVASTGESDESIGFPDYLPDDLEISWYNITDSCEADSPAA